MRCNQIGRERIQGKLHLPGTLHYIEKIPIFTAKWKGLVEIWEEDEDCLNLPVAL